MAKTGDASELEMAKTGGDAEEGAPAEEEAPKVLSLPVSGRGAHHVTLPSWVPEGVFDAAVEADQFRGFNGVRTNAASAKLELDADQKLVAKHDEEITLEDRGSTAITMFGSLAALVVFLLFVIMICVGWSTQEPVIDELEVETFDARYAMPDIAITIAFEGDNPGVSPPRGGRHWDEGAVMDYMWPEFAWAEFKNGFTNRNDTVTLLGAEDGVRFGSACDLAGGYKKGLEEKYVRDGDVKRKKKGMDRGSATWPVFCLLNSDRELEGRFGDPKWAALSLSINSCNGSKLGLSPEFEAEWNATGTGRCNYTSEFVPPAINVWFRFPREDWAKSGRLKPAQGGMLRDDQKWTWFVYETLSNEAWNRPITSNIDLRYNKVQVHGKKTLYDGSSGAGVDSFQEEFFSFYSYTSSPSGTSGATFANPPYFLTLVRIAPVRRDVSVRYQNVQEVISEISGSWSAALLVGYFIICALDEAVRLRIRASARATATAAVANTAEANGAATGFSEPTMLVLKPEDVEKLVEQRVKTLEQKVEALAKALVMHVPTSQALSEQNEPEPGGQKASEMRAPVTQAVSRIFK